MFIKLWLDVKHSNINGYFAFVVNWADVFQFPQLHKHFNVSGQAVATPYKFKVETILDDNNERDYYIFRLCGCSSPANNNPNIQSPIDRLKL